MLKKKKSNRSWSFVRVVPILCLLSLISVNYLSNKKVRNASTPTVDHGEADAVRALTDVACLNGTLERWRQVRLQSGRGKTNPGNNYATAIGTLARFELVFTAPQPPQGWEYIFTGGYDGQFEAVKKKK